jgi:diguanylate cyclase (GGDEF)-like protein
MKNPTSLRGLLWYPATLAIWLSISCAALVSSNIKTAIPGILALAIVAALSLVFQSTFLVTFIVACALIIFGYYTYSLDGILHTLVFTMTTFTAAIVGTAIIGWQTRIQIVLSSRQVERDRLLIDELRINDAKTGLMRFHYARRTLTTEISRSLRFNKSMAMLIMRIDHWEELAEQIGMEARDNLLVSVSEVLFGTLRNVDTLFLNIDKIGVILPETDEVGAKIVAKRVVDIVKKKTKVKLLVGIVNFPIDSISEEELFRKGELALKSAMQSGQEIIPFSQIQEITEEFSEEEQETGIKDNNPDLQINPYEVNQGKKITEGEICITFCEINSLTEIKPIQKELSNINEFEHVRLLDFRENEISFAVKTSSKDLQSVLKAYSGLSIDTISSVEGVYKINLKK